MHQTFSFQRRFAYFDDSTGNWITDLRDCAHVCAVVRSLTGLLGLPGSSDSPSSDSPSAPTAGSSDSPPARTFGLPGSSDSPPGLLSVSLLLLLPVLC